MAPLCLDTSHSGGQLTSGADSQAIIDSFIHEVANKVPEISNNEVYTVCNSCWSSVCHMHWLHHFYIAAEVHCSWHTHQVPPKNIYRSSCWKGGTFVAISYYQWCGAECSKSSYIRSAKTLTSASPEKAKGGTQLLNTALSLPSWCLMQMTLRLSMKVCSWVPLASICEKSLFQCFVSSACTWVLIVSCSFALWRHWRAPPQYWNSAGYWTSGYRLITLTVVKP